MIAEKIAVDVKNVQAQNILVPGPASLSLYLRFVNLNPFWVRVERIHFDIRIGHSPMTEDDRHEQWTLEAASAWPRFTYGHQGTWQEKAPYYTFLIDSSRAEFVRSQPDQWRRGIYMQLGLSLYGDSAAGTWKKEGLDIQISSDVIEGLH